MVIIGVDPGQGGAICFLDPTRNHIEFCRLDQTEAEIHYELSQLWPDSEKHCFIEGVHAMPKQGVTSSFTFGRNYGFVRGLLTALQIPFEEISPQKWQKALGCRTAGDKRISRAKAQQLYPKLVKQIIHKTADALLIAHYGKQILTQRDGVRWNLKPKRVK